jgi:hypothetical protein
MTHVELITSLIASIRGTGADATIDALRAERPAIVDGEYHDTVAVFFVWAVDRLVRAGLSDFGIVLHPLTDVRTPLAWWDAATLASPEAHDHFVPSTLALAHEPQPGVSHDLLAA